VNETSRLAIRQRVWAVMNRTRHPRTALLLVLVAVWVVLDQKEPFRSHFGLTLLGCGLSAGIAGLFLYWLGSRDRRDWPLGKGNGGNVP